MPYLQLAFNVPIRSTFTYSSDRDILPGCRAVAFFGKRKLSGCVVSVSEEKPAGNYEIKPIERVIDSEPLFDDKLLALARWTADLTMCSLGETLTAMLPGGKRESRDIASEDEAGSYSIHRDLTDEQNRSLETVLAKKNGWNYLYGITGSGKTEVFLQATEAVIAEGRGVIYLVPEIALSHQLIEGLQARFSGRVAVIHSGLTPSRRLAEWRRIQNGEAIFVLGARSAVFAPLDSPGLIIIDEEHEGSYKSSSTPRYHARQIAMRRCREEGARLLMGSATPSVEAWHLMNKGGLGRLELTERPAGGAPPVVSVVDLKHEKGLFSKQLLQAMNRVLGEGRQVLLFLNRRGFSYHYFCRSCGEELHCRHCSVPMTFHKSNGAMICHYCGARRRPPSTCPECGSVDMSAAGFGTEKVEEEVTSLFPEKRIFRLDTDAVRRKGVLEDALKNFREGRIDILLGTQMVAKGLNAPGVKLVCVLNADTTLNLPDFRSAERSFALIVQVAGRAGRFVPDGEVIVQTLRPDAAAIRLAAETKMGEFYDYELQQRDMLGFPPFSRLFRVVLKGPDESAVRRGAESLASLLAVNSEAYELLGPAECPIGRISGQYRRHILLRASAFNTTHASLSAAVENLKLPSGVRMETDVDPVSLL